jgi:hypothetical protein
MPIGMEIERGLDDQLGFDSRDQDFGRHFQRQAPELARADDVGERFACGAPGDQRVESSGEFGRLGVPSVGDQPGRVPSERMLREQPCAEFGFGGREAGFAQVLA